MSTQRQSGFTIIELLIATLVFSIILLLLSTGLIQIARIYYKGITTSRTQQTARTIMDSISRDIQFSGSSVPVTITSDGGGKYHFCVNNDRFTYQVNKQLADNPTGNQVAHVLIKDSPATCSSAGPADLTAPVAGAVELMGNNMRLVNLQISTPSTSLYTVTVRVVAGDDSYICSPTAGDCSSGVTDPHITNPTDLTCKTLSTGSQFCAVSELQTTIQKRI